MLYQIIVDCIIADHTQSLLINQNHWCYIKSLLTESHLLIKKVIDASIKCKSRSLITYKVIKFQITKSSSCHYLQYLYKVIKLQITESSSYHLYIIQSSNCKLQSHQTIIYILFSHQIANYKVIKLLFIHYSVIKLQIKSSNYHLYNITSISVSDCWIFFCFVSF